MTDRLASMAVFVRAADLGSFTAAGTALGLSSQMVGRHVSFLEDRLGAQLLQRSTRRQSLTAIGRTFYERCRVVLAEVEAAEAAARYVDVVGEGYDAVIRLGPLKDSELIARALVPYQLIACASPGYLAARGTPRTPADLVGHDCLGFVFACGQPLSEWSFNKQGQVHKVAVRSRFQVNDARVLRAAALEGQGVLLQANLILADDLATGRLVQILSDYETPTRALHILFAATRPPTQTLRSFIDYVVGRFGKRQGSETP